MNQALELQFMMFFLMGLGMFLKRKSIITDEGEQSITALLLDVILPCNILSAFSQNINDGQLMGSLQALGISVLQQGLCAVISFFCYRRIVSTKKSVMQYGTFVSNASFLGNPVVESLYGPVGLIYAAWYLIPMRISMWTVGISCYARQEKKPEWKKMLIHPCMLATEFGLFIMAGVVSIPSPFVRIVTSLGGCTTALSMLLVGTMLANVRFKGAISPELILYSLVRLLFLPLITVFLCILLHANPETSRVCALLASMPAGSTTAILATKYRMDAVFASQCILVTSLLSILVIPLWWNALSFIF